MNGEAFEPIRTEHLLLRPLSQNDATAMFRYRGDPDVARYQSWKPQSLEEIEAFIERNASNAALAPDTWYQIGIATACGSIIGDIGIHVTADEQVELGVTLEPGAQRRGFATEALTALLDRLFCDLRKHRVFASVDPRNHRSLALMHRLHFRQEGHFRESLYIDGEWVDDVVFAMLQQEWLHGAAARRRSWSRCDGGNSNAVRTDKSARRESQRELATRRAWERPREVYLVAAQRRRGTASRLRGLDVAIEEIA
jgi:RimJ/RimL family protein N-acetyltransferase